MSNKKIWVGLAATAVLVTGIFVIDSLDLLSPKSGAESEPKGKIVVVNGEGMVSVKPDIGYITIGVESSDLDAQKAQAMDKAAMNKVMEALKAQGIADGDIKTVNYSVWKGADYRKDPNGNQEYYHVSNQVEVTLQKVEEAGAVIDATTSAGANVVNNIRFDVKDRDTYYQQALEAAMKQSQSKAAGIMNTFGAKPGKPWRVTEQYSGGAPYEVAAMKMNMSEDAVRTPVMEGQMQIRAQVIVEYDY